MITVKEAAEILGVGEARVRKLCATGQIKAQKFGRDWAIVRESVEERAANTPPPGRRWHQN